MSKLLPNQNLAITACYTFNSEIEYEIPLLQSRIAAGFPSPADDFIEQTLDLNRYLIQHPAATFFVRVEGESMIDAGISSGDILIVDRAVQAADNKIVVVQLNGEFTVKRIANRNGRLYLVPASPVFTEIEITPEMDFEIWGVVTYVIHQAR